VEIQPPVTQVAEWMFDELKRTGTLHQDMAVAQIAAKFGRQFVYTNSNGNAAISRKVLAEFRKLAKKSAEWDRYDKFWSWEPPTPPLAD